MIPIIEDFREFEQLISNKLSENEQDTLHGMISMVELRLEGLQELTNERWEKL